MPINLNLKYKKEGDYLIPDLDLTDKTDRPLGMYSRMHEKYLKEHRPGTLTKLLMEGRLMEHLADIEEQTTAMIDAIMEQGEKNAPSRSEGTTAWVQYMTTLNEEARSTAIREIVYG